MMKPRAASREKLSSELLLIKSNRTSNSLPSTLVSHAFIGRYGIYSINRTRNCSPLNHINRFLTGGGGGGMFIRNIKARKKARFIAAREARNREEAAEHIEG